MLQTPTWVIDALDTDLRLRVTADSSDAQTFIGIGPAADVDAYLAGVAHDEITGLTNGAPVYRTSAGASESCTTSRADLLDRNDIRGPEHNS